MPFFSALLPAHNALLHLLRLRQTYLSGACSIAFRCVHPFTGKRRAVYGVVIVSYIAPYLPESYFAPIGRCAVLCHFLRSGVCHIHDHGTP